MRAKTDVYMQAISNLLLFCSIAMFFSDGMTLVIFYLKIICSNVVGSV